MDLIGGRQAKNVERYPVALVKAILRGLRKHMMGGTERMYIAELEIGPNVDEPEDIFKIDEWLKETAYYDDISGFELDPVLVRKARTEEMKFMSDLKVWKYASIADCIRCTRKKPLGLRWCDVNKGDNESPDVRARLVVQDVRSKSTIAVGDIAATFAATPPIECLRLILSLTMSLPIP